MDFTGGSEAQGGGFCLRKGTKNFLWRFRGDKSIDEVISNGIHFSVEFLRVLSC